MPALKITGLSKEFNGFKAVKNLDLEVKEKTVFGFLGPNGAGKTTTIRMIVGLSRPSGGQIEIAGQKVEFGKTQTNKLFGYLPEQPAFYGWMTGKEYLSFTANLLDLPKAEIGKAIEKNLKIVNLEDAKNKKISSYSNGMKQRLGIAQALIGDPQVLILDEPVSALDPIGRREVLKIIEELKKEKTIFMSTHVLADVDKVCDEVAILNHGKLMVQSPLAQLKEKYAAPILNVEFVKDPESLMKKLNEEDWAKKTEKTGNQIKIWLNNPKAMDANLPLKFFSRQDMGILNYGLTLPEAEDLFVEIVEGKHA